MAAPVIGPVPTLPVIKEGYTLVMPLFERMAKLAAVFKLTVFNRKSCGLTLCEAALDTIASLVSLEQLPKEPIKNKASNGTRK
jgi:hypothetical protein